MATVTHQEAPANRALLEAALRYARAGWWVFPCTPHGKAPLTEHGFKQATTDETTIRAWWRRWPNANIGVATGPSGLLVVDVDAHDGVRGLDSWRDLRHELKLNDDTITCETPTGGLHVYYAAGDKTLGCSAGKLGPGLDVKAQGGYVIAPPSQHPNGGTYGWALDSSPDECELRALPRALADALAEPKQPATPTLKKRIGRGQRNATLTSLGGTMRRRGMSERAIEAALLAENLARCDPPLSKREVAAIAKSVVRYKPAAFEDEATHRTDLGLAKRLISQFGEDLRFCAALGGWRVWDGKRWGLSAPSSIWLGARRV